MRARPLHMRAHERLGTSHHQHLQFGASPTEAPAHYDQGPPARTPLGGWQNSSHFQRGLARPDPGFWTSHRPNGREPTRTPTKHPESREKRPALFSALRSAPRSGSLERASWPGELEPPVAQKMEFDMFCIKLVYAEGLRVNQDLQFKIWCFRDSSSLIP